MRLVHRDADLILYQGNAEDWPNGDWVDLVFTNPYGPMPVGLAKTPAIIHQWAHRKHEAERWTHMKLTDEIGRWNGGREVFWANAHLRPRNLGVDISAYRPEQPGWYPEQMVRDLLKTFGRPGWVVWDGFMGRGTVGKVARELGMKYIGVEQLPEHIEIARAYLGV